ncbi:hypothetical protein [Streptomyces sp. NPDC001568]|uniref:hypothetical protein n=1 Tax=Streptomyces sp. NPDC001568 TaxID=3364588 RepID=UPI0036965802
MEAGDAAARNSVIEPVAPVAARAALPLPSGDLTAAGQDELVRAVDRFSAGKLSGNRSRQRQGMRMITGLLAQYPGETWQERWLASSMDAEGAAPLLPGIRGISR